MEELSWATIHVAFFHILPEEKMRKHGGWMRLPQFRDNSNVQNLSYCGSNTTTQNRFHSRGKDGIKKNQSKMHKT